MYIRRAQQICNCLPQITLLKSRYQHKLTVEIVSTCIANRHNLSLDELEQCLIDPAIDNQSKQLLLRPLFLTCVRHGEFARALEVKEAYHALKFPHAFDVLTATFYLYTALKDFPQAERALAMLESKYPDCKIDIHKLVKFAALLVQNNKLERAIELLKARSEHITRRGYLPYRSVLFLLNNIAIHNAVQQNSNPNSSRIRHNSVYEVYELLRHLAPFKPKGTIFLAMLQERLFSGDIRAAANLFSFLERRFGDISLEHKLLSVLVRLSNNDKFEIERYAPFKAEEAQQLLKETIEVISHVRGIYAANASLLIAIARSGKHGQIRQRIFDPEYRCDPKAFLLLCSKLAMNNEYKTLLRLAHELRGVPNFINEERIYDIILHHLKISKDPDVAKELHSAIRNDKEFQTSNDFLSSLQRILDENQC